MILLPGDSVPAILLGATVGIKLIFTDSSRQQFTNGSQHAAKLIGTGAFWGASGVDIDLRRCGGVRHLLLLLLRIFAKFLTRRLRLLLLLFLMRLRLLFLALL